MSSFRTGEDGAAHAVPLVFQTSWRGMVLEESLRLAERAKKFAGISRVSRIDGLTEINVPIFAISRPLAKASVTVNSGKGVTVEESRASGLFEAIEVAAAEQRTLSVVSSEQNLILSGQPHVTLSALCATAERKEFPWIAAKDFETSETVMVPECAVSLLGDQPAFSADTNGLASGTSFMEAVFHGLLELLERHNHSLALVHEHGFSVELEKVEDPFVSSLLEYLKNIGMTVETKDISDFTGIPTYYTLIFNPSEQDSHLVSGGLGCHLDPMIALRRALTEAIQARAVAVSGAREDITATQRERGHAFLENQRIFKFWFESSAKKAPLPKAIAPVPFADAIKEVLRVAREHEPALGRLICYEYEAPEGIHVVRTILENCESFGLIRHRVGAKVQAAFDLYERACE